MQDTSRSYLLSNAGIIGCWRIRTPSVLDDAVASKGIRELLDAPEKTGNVHPEDPRMRLLRDRLAVEAHDM